MQENGWGLLRTEPEGGGLASFACRVAGITAIMKRFIVLLASLLVAYFQKKIRGKPKPAGEPVTIPLNDATPCR